MPLIHPYHSLLLPRNDILPHLHQISWQVKYTKRLWRLIFGYQPNRSTSFWHREAISSPQIPRFRPLRLRGIDRPIPMFGRKASSRWYPPNQTRELQWHECLFVLVLLRCHRVSNDWRWPLQQ